MRYETSNKRLRKLIISSILVLTTVITIACSTIIYPVRAEENVNQGNIDIINEKILDNLPLLAQQKETLTENQKKIDLKILNIAQNARKSMEKGIDPQFQSFTNSIVKVDNSGRFSVEIRVSSLSPEQRQLLLMSGMNIETAIPEYGLVKGTIPYNQIEAVSRLDFVTSIGNPGIMLLHTGGINSAGDNILKADIARATYGYNGTGIKIGVISDGVSNLVDSVASGDLPMFPAVDVRKTGIGDEGTAMLEIIHDLAPGSELAFYGPSDSTDMVTAINTLAATGCDIIVDDLVFSNEPKFEDGPIAQAARSYCNNSGVYVTSAGNSALRHYYHQYNPLATGEETYPFVHNYGSNDIGNSFVIPAGGGIFALLQWNNRWGQSGDDFAFVLYDAGGNFLNGSDQSQTGSGNPYEYFSWSNTSGSDKTVFLSIIEYSTTSARASIVFDYHVWYGNSLEYVVASNSIIGHEAIPEVLSCAAASAATPDTIEYFSSQGPGTVFFPSFQERQLPNITGIDGVNTKIGTLGHFSNPFYGTSAAAPHIAAVAALVWSADLTLTAVEVSSLIKNNAIDKGTAGYDYVWGNGRADAEKAVDNVNRAPSVNSLTTTNVTTTSAMLNGELTSLGTENPVNVSFLWGMDPQHWSETTPQAMTDTGYFSANITVSAGKTYYFRAKATGDGTVLGTQLNFLSTPIPQMEEISEPEGRWYSTDPLISSLSFNDIIGLDDGFYQIDGYYSGNWTALFTSCNTTLWSSDDWSVSQSEFDNIDEGEHCIYFMATNDDGEEEGEAGEWEWTFFKDTINPTSVNNLTSSTHTNNWSTSNRITVNWTAAIDNGSGVTGYAIVWNNNNTTNPSNEKNTGNVTTLTSPVLADGNNYYFHIKAVDQAGNWGLTAHAGPYAIDTTAPTGSGDNLTSTSHQTGVWSSDNTVAVSWTTATDGSSGLAGYAIKWDQSPTTNPDLVINTDNQTTDNTTELVDGMGYYFHIKAKDNAGNWSSPQHLGPFHISVYSPVLSYGAVSPASGYQNGKYIYSINYRHPQGLPPAAINVVIDGTALDNMTWTTGQSGNYTTDQVFIFEVSGSSLTVGSHTYTFSATDNASHTALGDIEITAGQRSLPRQAAGLADGGRRRWRAGGAGHHQLEYFYQQRRFVQPARGSQIRGREGVDQICQRSPGTNKRQDPVEKCENSAGEQPGGSSVRQFRGRFSL